MQQRIIIWDNDGTIVGSKDPSDMSPSAKVILPNVAATMSQPGTVNIICSGMKTDISELQNFDPLAIIEKLKKLMFVLPIKAAVFSPAIGGTQCWVLIRSNDTDFEVRQAHEDVRYRHLIGQFKKPDIGMLIVIKDLIQEFGLTANAHDMVFIGDAQQDRIASEAAGIPFMWAQYIHDGHSLDTIRK